MLAFALATARLDEEADALARQTLAEVERALGVDAPLYELCACIRGNCALRNGDAQDAERWYHLVLELAEKRGALAMVSFAHVNIGLALGSQGRWAEAEGRFRRAREISSPLFGENAVYSSIALQMLARSLYEQGREDEADAEFRDMIERFARSDDLEQRSSRDDTRQRYVALLGRAGRNEEAESIARAGVAIARPAWVREPSDVQAAGSLVHALCLWSGTLDALGRRGDACAAAREACTVSEDALGQAGSASIDLMPRLAGQLQAFDLWREAERIQRGIVEVQRRELGDSDLRTLGALNDLAWNLHRQGRDAEAEPLAEECVIALRAHPYASKERLAPALDTLASARLGLGRAQEAEPLFAEAVQLVPHSGEGELNYAGCLIELGRLGEAEQRIARARELDPSDRVVMERSIRYAERVAELRAAQKPAGGS